MTGRARPVAVGLAVVALVVVGGLALAALVPPRAVEYGGGDEENYLANGVRQATQPEAAYRFLPPEWEDLPAEERAELRRAFLDAESRMFRLLRLPPDADDADDPTYAPAIARKKATVDEQDRIRIAHDNLYATVLAGLVLIESRHLPLLANDVLLVAAGLVLGLIVWSVVRRWWAAVLAGALLVALPSMVEAARITRTETFATLLFLVFVWWSMRDRGRTAWPGLLLVALWTTRQEFVIPLLVYLGWAAWRRRPGGLVVALATVAAGYLHPWGLAEPGELFATGRDVFARVPTIPAWVVVPGYMVLRLAADRVADTSDGWARRWEAVGEWRWVHRVVWSVLLVGAAAAEALRRTLELGERGWLVLKGPRLSTLDVLVDSAGWPLLVLGAAGLIWGGYRLAGRIPFVVALVSTPTAYVLVRMSASGSDLWAWSRRFHMVLYPVLILGVILLLVEVVERFDRAERPVWRPVGVGLAVILVVVTVVAAMGPHDDRPEGDAPTRADADGLHEAVDRLDPDAAVILSPRFGSQKAQLPIRVHGDRWSFVVWSEEAARSVLPAALACAERTVYVEDDVLELADTAGARVEGDPVVLPARYNEGPGRDVTLRRVVLDDPCPSTEAVS